MGRFLSEVLLILFVLFFEASQLCLCRNLTDEGCIEEERQSLLKFRGSFDNYSRHILAWDGKQCCKWKGVKCDAITGHVVNIDLSPKSYPMAWQLIKDVLWFPNCSSVAQEVTSDGGSNILKCSLSSKAMSPSLLELKHLNYLDLSLIDFQYSSIPVFLGSMKQLRYLNLSQTFFSGRVPHQLGNLTNLQILDLSSVGNLYMDDFTWVSHLSSLQYIDMSEVRIRNEINSMMQVILNLPILLQAHFEFCRINSSKSSQGFVNSSSLPSKLQVLNLGGIFLNAIPKALQNMTSLRSLDLSETFIDSVPLWLAKFKCLAHLDLAGNRISGLFPIVIQNISSLKYLDLSSNNLTSAVPVWFIERVQHVYLTNNKFSTLESSCPSNSKNISESIGSDLQALDLSHNELKDVADSLGQLKNLEHLNLASNLLYGPIPLSFRNFTKLRELILEDNHFNGTIPAFLGRFSSLRVLDLSNNHLKGYIPDSLGKLQNLKILNLSTNSIEGALGEIHLRNLFYLQDLSLGMNKLSMELAPNWLPPFQLKSLELSSCNIGTSFPQWLRNQKKLVKLDLSNTGLWGILPTWFQQKDLLVLDLSNNKISGQLPRNIHDMMPYLNSIYLGNNLLNGSIPKSLCKLSRLQDLDLSKNKLSSEIPSCLGESDRILLIDLSSNKLSGTIPESFCSSYGSYSLQSLNLSNNSLQGELPSTLPSCKSLEILDLGNNELYGIIPSKIWTNSSVLKILRLRQNRFNGSIPSTICQLSYLQSLDIASNNLSGPIPFCIGNMEGMMMNKALDNGPKVYEASEIVDAARNISAKPFPTFDQWEKEDVKQFIKGRELDFTKNLKFVINMDLSDNNLVGFIPEVLTSLTGLVSLNLSHNFFSGKIPRKIGKLKQLESLDISWNQLAGPLPSGMSSLTSLSHLNLSYNNFSGPIPQGNQFLTLDDSSIYVGNQYLCGEPVLIKCNNNENNEAPTSVHYEDENEKEKLLFYFVVAMGFMTGFWGIIALLVFNKSLRYVCFRYMEKIGDEIYVAIVIRVARLKRTRFC